VVGLSGAPEWIGNPVRKEIRAAGLEGGSQSAEQINVLVIGGSQGAHSLNIHLPTMFAQQSRPLTIWHQSGEGRSETVAAAYAQLGLDAKVSEFIEDMAAAYLWADVLVCRAGAMTIAECCAAAKPALLIPFPNSAGDHQDFNAEFLVAAGGAKMISNSALAEESSRKVFAALIADRANLKRMGAAAHKMHKPNALANTVAICEEYLYA
jgi:UDP-N-acetylglucosamine--N-acetylmuramyl-(pentapeptide) pyrophosphoryl-undecaprenol N-acetylglucosamine transferase